MIGNRQEDAENCLLCCQAAAQAKKLILRWPDLLWPGSDLSSLLCRAVTTLALAGLTFKPDPEDDEAAVLTEDLYLSVWYATIKQCLSDPDFSELEQCVQSKTKLVKSLTSANLPFPVFNIERISIPWNIIIQVRLCELIDKAQETGGLPGCRNFETGYGKIRYYPDRVPEKPTEIDDAASDFPSEYLRWGGDPTWSSSEDEAAPPPSLPTKHVFVPAGARARVGVEHLASPDHSALTGVSPGAAAAAAAAAAGRAVRGAVGPAAASASASAHVPPNSAAARTAAAAAAAAAAEKSAPPSAALPRAAAAGGDQAPHSIGVLRRLSAAQLAGITPSGFGGPPRESAVRDGGASYRDAIQSQIQNPAK